MHKSAEGVASTFGRGARRRFPLVDVEDESSIRNEHRNGSFVAPTDD
jgi:hypothetical protein